MDHSQQAPQHLRVETGRIARVTLARPPLNILNIEMMSELARVLRDLAPHEPALVVLQAEGRAFSAGADVGDHRPELVGGMLEVFHSVFHALDALEAPVIAKVHGAALGAGCELVTVCDLVYAARSATFGQPEIRLGAFPPLAAVELPRVVGARRAAEMILGGGPIGAEEAAGWGLVNRVWPDEDFEAGAETAIAGLAGHSRTVLAMAKAALRLGRGRSAEEALPEIEVLYLDKLMKTQDAREGIAAFLEKRAPVFRDL